VIEVPEANYHRDLIRIFGFLLAGLLLGLALGYVIRPLAGLAKPENALLGLAVGLGLSGFGLFSYFRTRKRHSGYPMIVEISDKGGPHGQT
jgi:hypothetical protein